MAFDISYVFTARDKYTAIAKKIAAANDSVKRSAANASASMAASYEKSANKVAASYEKMKAAAVKFQAQGKAMRNTGAVATAAITLPLLLIANGMANAASDADETASKYSVVFAGLGADAEMMADKFADSFGLAGSSARKLLGDTGDLLTGFGFSQQKAADLSVQVNALAVDLASFTNFSGGAEGASSAITKALFGEREALKSLGVAISEDLVKKKIMTMMSHGSKFASLQEAKAVATLQLAMEQSKNAIGDYARTKEGAANVSRLATEKLKSMYEVMGKHLLPVQIAFNKAIIKTSDYLSSLSPTAQKAILIVGGLVAVAGPLLLVIGSIALALPLLTAGFAGIGTAIAAVGGFLLGPVFLIGALVAAIVYLMAKSKTVAAFFSGFMQGISDSMGPVLKGIVADLSAAAGVIATIFGDDSDSSKALDGTSARLDSISSAGQMMGKIVGGVLDGIVTTLQVIGDLLGQIIGAVATLDLGQFDMSGMKDRVSGFAERMGWVDAKQPVPPAALVAASEGTSTKAAMTVAPSFFEGKGDQGKGVPVAMMAPAAQSAVPDSISRWAVVPPLKVLSESTSPDFMAQSANAAINAPSLPPSMAPAEASQTTVKSSSSVSINGNISVSAGKGSKVDSVDSKTEFTGARGNIGLGAAA